MDAKTLIKTKLIKSDRKTRKAVLDFALDVADPDTLVLLAEFVNGIC